MAAGQVYKGKNLRIRVGGETIFHATECSFSSTMEVEGVASKDTNGQIKSTGNYDWSLSTNFLVADKAVASTQEDAVSLLNKFKAGTAVEVEFTTGVEGDFIISGSAYIESINLSAAVSGTATGDASFSGNGDFEVAAVPAP